MNMNRPTLSFLCNGEVAVVAMVVVVVNEQDNNTWFLVNSHKQNASFVQRYGSKMS